MVAITEPFAMSRLPQSLVLQQWCILVLSRHLSAVMLDPFPA